MILLKIKNQYTIICFVFGLLCIIFVVFSFRSCQKIDQTASTLVDHSFPVIVLDPGHGGEDGGAMSDDKMMEKDINLDIALKLQKLLELSGFQVVMTREADIAINDPDLKTVRERKVSDLHNRLKILEEYPNGVLLSIHQNHFSDGKYYGAQIFYSQNTEESKILAENIQKEIVTLIQPENKREIKPASDSIYLLWNAQVPAVIVECGFLSNDAEAKKLGDSTYQNQMAFAIYQGFLDYLQT